MRKKEERKNCWVFKSSDHFDYHHVETGVYAKSKKLTGKEIFELKRLLVIEMI